MKEIFGLCFWTLRRLTFLFGYERISDCIRRENLPAEAVLW